MAYRKWLDYMGDISQIGGVKRYQMLEGKAKGVEAVDVDDGQGLRYTVLVDRGMDLGRLVYHDCGITFQAAAGITAPQYYNERGEEWLQSFGGGFLTTCGLTQVGDPCVFEGQPYGLHGQVSNLPARLERCEEKWQGDDYVREAASSSSVPYAASKNHPSLPYAVPEYRFRYPDLRTDIRNSYDTEA